MSNTALTWAWGLTDLSSTEKLVLVALADRANRARRCWPSLADIGRRCCLDPRSARRALASLEKRGLVHRRRRLAETGVSTSNEYFLAVSIGGPTVRVGGPTVRVGGPTVRVRGTHSPGDPDPQSAKPKGEPSVEPKNPSAPSAPGGGLDVGEAFAAFWSRYPRRGGKRVGKAEAQRAYQRLATSQRAVDDLHAALATYRAHCGEYPKDPHRWLSGDRWREWLAPDIDATPTTAAGDERYTAIPFLQAVGDE